VAIEILLKVLEFEIAILSGKFKKNGKKKLKI